MGILGGLLSDATGGFASYFGGQSAKSALREGRNSANTLEQKGTTGYKDAMTQGVNRANPYLSAGEMAIGKQQDLLQNGMPKQSDAFNFDAWKDPSTQYSISESNKALQAAGLAGGNAGGALAKALQGNANSLAQQAYGNAYGRYIQQNQQDFGQQQQNFKNAYHGWNDMANLGQNTMQGVNSMGMQGADGMANLYGSMANRSMNTANNIAAINAQQATGAGNAMQSSINDFSSGAKSGDFGSFLSNIF